MPAAIGLVGLALVGALAAGPIMRSVSSFDADRAVSAAGTAVETASVVQAASAEPAPAPVATAAVKNPAPVKAAVAADPAPQTPPAPVEKTVAKDEAGLSATDPRWSEDALTVDETKLSALKKAVEETVIAAEIAGAMGNGDGVVTGSIGTRAGYLPDRPAMPASDSRAAFDAAIVTEDEAQEPAAVAGADLAPAKATQYVNMRSGPSDEASVMTVVPANAAIEAERDCNWCSVSYDGKQGYIYKSFITR